MCVLKFMNIEPCEFIMGFPGASVVKNLPAKAGDADLIPGSGRFPGAGNGNPPQYSVHGIFQARILGWIAIPWSRKWQSTPVFLPGKFHGQSCRVG